MAVSQIVNPDALYPCRLSTSVHFMMKIAFRGFKQPVVFADSVELFYIVLHFFTEELRHFDRPIAFRRFRVSDDVPATDALKETGLSIIFSENFSYSSCVQKIISLALALPILPTLAAGLSFSP